MRTKRVGSALAFVLLVLSVHLVAVWLARAYPESSCTVRLAVLAAAAKLTGDLLFRANSGPTRRTVYYQDYLVDWFWFAVLAFVGLVLYAAAARLVGAPPAPGPVALGIYLIARATFRRG